MGLLSAVLSVLGILFAGPLVSLFADGYDAQTAELAVSLTRVMFPTVLFTGVAFSFVGVLQSLGEFNVPALISVVSNLVIILYYLTLDQQFGIYGLAVAFLVEPVRPHDGAMNTSRSRVASFESSAPARVFQTPASSNAPCSRYTTGKRSPGLRSAGRNA